MFQRKSLVAVCAVGALTWPRSAAAQASSAGALFDQGVAYMEEKRFDRACPAIEVSYWLDARPGTLFTLAECEAERGRLAMAVARYDEYLEVFDTLTLDQKAKQRDREKRARAQKAVLGPQVPELTLKLPPDAPPGTVVRQDGVELPKAAVGIALQIDPGKYLVTTQAPGGPVTELRLVIGKGERREIMLHVQGAPQAPPVLVPKPPDHPAIAPHTPPLPDHASPQRVAAFIAGGLGLASLIVGGVTGALAMEQKGMILANCAGTLCNATGKAAADRVRALGLASTLGFAAGIAGVGAGAVLFVTEPARPTRFMMLELHGQW